MSKLHFIDYVQYYWWGDATLLESAGKYLLMDTCHEDGIYLIRYLKDHGVKEGQGRRAFRQQEPRGRRLRRAGRRG